MPKRATEQGTKYNSLRGAILKDVQAGVYRVGEQLPGERVLAARYGVAHMTMRQAISLLVDEGILSRKSRVGTFLRPLAAGTGEAARPTITKTIVLLPRFDRRRGSPVQHGVLEAVYDTVSKVGISTEVQYYDSVGSLVERLRECAALRDVMLIVWYLDSPEAQGMIRRLRANQVPLVLVDSHLGELCDFVVTDNAGGAARMVAYLQSLGHSRLTYLTLAGTVSSLRERQQGAVDAARAAGMACTTIELPATTPHADLPGLLTYLARNHAEAVFACNDHLAIECLGVCRKLGLAIPESFSLVGFDDIDIAAPLQLTTVMQDFWEMGHLAAARLLQRLAPDARGDDVPGGARLEPELKIRSSCRSLDSVTVA